MPVAGVLPWPVFALGSSREEIRERRCLVAGCPAASEKEEGGDREGVNWAHNLAGSPELELELLQSQRAQKPVLRGGLSGVYTPRPDGSSTKTASPRGQRWRVRRASPRVYIYI